MKTAEDIVREIYKNPQPNRPCITIVNGINANDMTREELVIAIHRVLTGTERRYEMEDEFIWEEVAMEIVRRDMDELNAQHPGFILTASLIVRVVAERSQKGDVFKDLKPAEVCQIILRAIDYSYKQVGDADKRMKAEETA